VATPAEKPCEIVCDNAYCLLLEFYDRGGFGLLGFLLVGFVFYKLVWKVWTAAMRSKDKEIERLVEERNFYQRRILPDRLTSDDDDESGPTQGN
jgi:hypothetical protein